MALQLLQEQVLLAGRQPGNCQRARRILRRTLRQAEPARGEEGAHTIGASPPIDVPAIVGTALIAGTGGTIVFGVLGLAASIPLLLRLRRRFGSWWAPVIGAAVFAVMLSLSAFVIGPAISGGGDGGGQPPADQPTPSPGHNEHHP